MASEILTIVVSGNGLPPIRRQAINWSNDDLLLVGPLRTKFSETLIKSRKKSSIQNEFENVGHFC